MQDKVAKAQEVKDLAISGLTQAIEDEKKEQWRVEGRSMLFDAKRVSSFCLKKVLVYPGHGIICIHGILFSESDIDSFC